MRKDKNHVVSTAEDIHVRQGLRQFCFSNDRTAKEPFIWLKKASNEGDLEALNLWQEINTKNYMLRRYYELNTF